jgi:hypothetical protein
MPQIMPNEGTQEPKSVLIIISQVSESLCILSILFIQYNFFYTALYLTDYQPFTKPRFWTEKSGTLDSLNSDFRLSKLPL